MLTVIRLCCIVSTTLLLQVYLSRPDLVSSTESQLSDIAYGSFGTA